MAIVKDRVAVLNEDIARLVELQGKITNRIQQLQGNPSSQSSGI